MACIWIMVLIFSTAQAYEVNKKFIFNSVPASWTAAERFCNCFGGHLVSVTTMEKLKSLVNYVTDIYGSSAGDQWIGLFDSQPPGQEFAWSDCCKGEEQFLKQIWFNGEPNFPDEEECVRLSYTDSSIKTRACHQEYPFICETGGCSWTVRCQTQFAELENIIVVGKVSLQECIDSCNVMTSSQQCLGISYSSSTCFIANGTSEKGGFLSVAVVASKGSVSITRTCNDDYILVHKEVIVGSETNPHDACIGTYTNCSVDPTTYIDQSQEDVQMACKQTSIVLADVGTLGLQLKTNSSQRNISDIVTDIYDECVNSQTTLSSQIDSTSTSAKDVSSGIADETTPEKSESISVQTPVQIILTNTFSSYTSRSEPPFSGLLGSDNDFQWTSKEQFSSGTLTSSKKIASSDYLLQGSSDIFSSSSNVFEQISTVPSAATLTLHSQELLPEVPEPTITLGTTHSVQATTEQTGSNGLACGCFCFAANHSLADAYFNAELLKRLLLLDKEKLSRWRRLLTSASDPRPSATACGAGGIAFLAVCGIVLLLFDATRLCAMKKRTHFYKDIKLNGTY